MVEFGSVWFSLAKFGSGQSGSVWFDFGSVQFTKYLVISSRVLHAAQFGPVLAQFGVVEFARAG